jgi:hypothetical protein
MRAGGWRVECHRLGCGWHTDTLTRDYADTYAHAHARACRRPMPPDLTAERYGDPWQLEAERFAR